MSSAPHLATLGSDFIVALRAPCPLPDVIQVVRYGCFFPPRPFGLFLKLAAQGEALSFRHRAGVLAVCHMAELQGNQVRLGVESFVILVSMSFFCGKID